MQPFANFALTASILTCALGAVVLCLVVYRYGLSDSTDERSDATLHRAYMTRLGHVAGAVCFAVAAGLTIVAVAVHSRVAATPETVVEAPSDDVTRQLDETRAQQADVTERLRTVGERLQRAEATIDRLRAEQAQATVKLAKMEQLTAKLVDPDPERTARMKPAPTRDAARGATAFGRSGPSPAAVTPSVGQPLSLSASPVPPSPRASQPARASERSTSATVTSPKTTPPASSGLVGPPPTAASPRTTSPVVPTPSRSVAPSTPPPAGAASPVTSSGSSAPAAISPPRLTPVASPPPAPAVSGPATPYVAGPPSPREAAGSGPAGGDGGAAEPGRDSPPDRGRGEPPAATPGPGDGARDQDIFTQAQRAMSSTSRAATKQVERFARDVRDVFVHFGRSMRGAFE